MALLTETEFTYNINHSLDQELNVPGVAFSGFGRESVAASSIHALPDGGYLVLWSTDHNLAPIGGARDETAYGVYVQLFAADNTEITAPIRVEPESALWPFRPDVEIAANGDFIVSWAEYVGDTPISHDFFYNSTGAQFSQSFDAAGNRLGVPVDLGTTIDRSFPDNSVITTQLTNGNIVQITFDLDTRESSGQITDADGVPLGIMFPLDSHPTTVMALQQGGFLILSGPVVQTYSDEAEPIGRPISVGNISRFPHEYVSLAELTDGTLMVLTRVEYNDGHVEDSTNTWLYTRSYDPRLAYLGTDQNDEFIGGETDDVIIFGMGDDSASGGLGADEIHGDFGNDTLRGGAGNDTLFGGDGYDKLHGDDGDDIIYGGPDEFYSLSGYRDIRDEITGGAGNDWISAGAGNDLVFGQDGNDTIIGGFGADTLIGQNGDDVITGSGLSDLVFGGAGNDIVNGGFGHDRINGGTGADRFYHLGIMDHGSDWIQDYNNAEGDTLLFGQTDASLDQFQVNFAHTENASGERSGGDTIEEAFVIYRPTGQIIWALVDGGGQAEINIQLSGEVFDLLA